MKRWNKSIPEGTRDIVFSEADIYSDITGKFKNVFLKNGFKEISTPVIEYYDVFDYSGQSIAQEDMYKLTDNNGRLIVLRADNTTPAARVVAAKLQNEALPQKLFYNQYVYRLNSDYSGKRNEVLQSGVEIIGTNGIKSDLVCISTAIETLHSLNINYKIEIGHVGFYNSLIDELKLNDDDRRLIRGYVDSKNAVSLNIMNKIANFDKIRRIPLLFGGSEVFSEAEILADNNQNALKALAYVKTLYSLLTSAGYGNNIMVDMGMVHKIDYYTGVIFNGYIDGVGEPVLQGGRYDNLLKNFDFDNPATGFAINVSLVADSVSGNANVTKEPDGYIIHFIPEKFNEAENLKNSVVNGEYSCFEDINDTISYAKQNKNRIKYLAVVDNSGTKIDEVGNSL